MIVLAPDPAWVACLPNGKLPDRHDFLSYGTDHDARAKAWNAAASASRQLADEFASGCMHLIRVGSRLYSFLQITTKPDSRGGRASWNSG
jgi:hypothetical protein